MTFGFTFPPLLPPEPELGQRTECVGGGPLDGATVPYAGREYVELCPEAPEPPAPPPAHHHAPPARLEHRVELYERAVLREADGSRRWVYLHRGQRWPY